MGEVEGEGAGMAELTSSNQPLSVKGGEGEPLGGLTAIVCLAPSFLAPAHSLSEKWLVLRGSRSLKWS